LTPVGAPGTVAGVTGADALEVADVPCTLVALTVKVYAVPFVRPIAVVFVAFVVVANAAGLEITV
jgi:hypothetical protein